MKTGFDRLESHSARCVEDPLPIAALSGLTLCSLVHYEMHNLGVEHEHPKVTV